MGGNKIKAFSIVTICVFGIIFSLFLTITGVFRELPIGGIFFSGIMACIVNGVFYGLIGGLIYAAGLSLRGPKPESTVRFKPKNEVKGESKDGVPIIYIEGIGDVYAKKLDSVGVFTTAHLLEKGGTKIGRKNLAKKTVISEKLILKWVNLSDLMRIEGVDEEYSDILEEAGVDTIVELAQRNPDNLFSRIMEINEKKKLVTRTPTLNAVKSWIKQAKKLPRKVEY